MLSRMEKTKGKIMIRRLKCWLSFHAGIDEEGVMFPSGFLSEGLTC